VITHRDLRRSIRLTEAFSELAYPKSDRPRALHIHIAAVPAGEIACCARRPGLPAERPGQSGLPKPALAGGNPAPALGGRW